MGPSGMGRRGLLTGEVFLGGSFVAAAFGGGFLIATDETMQVVQQGSVGAEGSGAIFEGGGEQACLSAAFRFPRVGAMVTLGLVVVPKETRGDLELSFGGVSITGAIGDGGQSWEM